MIIEEPKLFTISELKKAIGSSTIRYLVQDTLPLTGISLLSAKPKHGKSALIRNLIKAVVLGEGFLNLEVTKGNVVYLQLEESDALSISRLQELKIPEDSGLFFLKIPARADFKSKVNAIKRAIRDVEPRLVIIDPLNRFVDVDVNDYTEVTRQMNPLVDVARSYDCHLMLAHHSNKGIGDQQSRILGSTALAGAMDTMLFLERSSNVSRLSSSGRYPGFAPVKFKMERGLVSDLQADNAEAGPADDRIVDFVRSAGPSTESQIRAGTGLSSAVIYKILGKLVEIGGIVRTGAGTKAEPYKFDSPL